MPAKYSIDPPAILRFLYMLPPSNTFNGSLKQQHALCVLCLLFFVAACAPPEDRANQNSEEGEGTAFVPDYDQDFEQDVNDLDEAFTLMGSMKEDAIRESYRKLREYNYTRYTRTEQRDIEEAIIAFEERTMRYELDEGVRYLYVDEADSTGTFDFGLFNQFVSSNTGSNDPPDMTRFVLPREPAYKDQRNQEAYQYRMRPDTLMGNIVARIIDIRAVPDLGDGQNVRRVRLFVDRSSLQLIGIYIERIDLAMLFREESQFYLDVRQTDEREWVPNNTRFKTNIKVPFNPDQTFSTVSTFYDFVPAL